MSDADTPPEWDGWIYSKCNLRGHPGEEHWHPPVGQTPALDATRAAPGLREALVIAAANIPQSVWSGMDDAAKALINAALSQPEAGIDVAWAAAEAALPERLDERSLSFWFDTRKPSGWRAAASHRFDPLRPVPLVVEGFDSPAAALHALADRLTAPGKSA